MTSGTYFNSPLYSDVGIKCYEEAEAPCEAGKHVRVVNVQSIIREQLLIRNLTDIASFFPKTMGEIDSSFHFVKSNVLVCLHQITSISPDARTFENTVLEYDRTRAYFQMHGSMLAILKMLHPDKDMRKKAEEVHHNWTNGMVDLFETNKEIFKSFKDFQALNNEFLDEERSYYFRNVMLGFRRAGLELGSEQYFEMQELQKKISSLSSEFRANLAEDASSLSLNRDELAGIDQGFVNSLTRNAEKYVLVCDHPTYFQVMTNCSIESTRRDYLRLFNNRAFPNNINILNQLVDCRDQLANLLGFGSYAEFDIAPQAAQRPENVEKFIDDLSLTVYPNIKSNWSTLLRDVPESITLTQEGKVKSWDVAYIANQYLKKHFNINQDQIAEYFPMEATIRSLLSVYEKFFNLKFQVIENEKYWESPVQTIEVRCGEGNRSLVGYILLDLFPRENKYTHCCCNCIVPPISYDHGITFEPALAVVIANFSKSTKEKPSLLKHHEVKTFFHEFGHAIHALLGKAEMPTKAAYNTQMDFIETPSQLLEEWMWDSTILKMISHHYQTGESLADSLIDGLIQTRTFMDAAHDSTAGNSDHVGTELLFAKLSLAVFQKGKSKDLAQIHQEIYEKMSPIVAYDPEQHHICAFEHLGAYGAKYYSYPWSKQLALKIFNYIKSHGGLLDPVMGERYISKIIGRGGSLDPNLLMNDFLHAETTSTDRSIF